MEKTISDEKLIAWAHWLVGYARDWDETFENRPTYFTQEFWYLLVLCTIAVWQGAPLTVSAACQTMKSGSNRTREDRIKKAVQDGYLIKEKSSDDKRTIVLLPTDKLATILKSHLQRTFASARDQLIDS